MNIKTRQTYYAIYNNCDYYACNYYSIDNIINAISHDYNVSREFAKRVYQRYDCMYIVTRRCNDKIIKTQHKYYAHFQRMIKRYKLI